MLRSQIYEITYFDPNSLVNGGIFRFRSDSVFPFSEKNEAPGGAEMRNGDISDKFGRRPDHST